MSYIIKKINKMFNLPIYDNTFLVIIISTVLIIIGTVLFFVYAIKTTNTGKIIWKTYPIRYLEIPPPANLMEIIGYKGSEPQKKEDSKELTINGKKIIISYITEGSIPLLDKIDKEIDKLALIEYSVETIATILYGQSSNFALENIKIQYSQKFDNSDNKYYSGAQELHSPDNKSVSVIQTNFSFIEEIYAETDHDEFLEYYIGLFMHEITHSFLMPDLDSNSVEDDENRSRISENISEYIRLVAGFMRYKDLGMLNKTLPTEKYGAEGAYYLYFLQNKYPGILSKLIHYTIKLDKTLDNTLIDYTGKTNEELFAEFKEDLKKIF
jgi:hypothetical protein